MGNFARNAAPIIGVGLILMRSGNAAQPAKGKEDSPVAIPVPVPAPTPGPGTVETPAVTPPANAGQNATAFEMRLATVDAKMAEVVDLRADFEQRKKTSILKKPIVSRGSMVCKGETVLWRTSTPRKSDMLVAEGKVTVYYPEDKLAEVYPMGSRFKDAAGGPLPRLSKLRDNFEIAELDARGMVAAGSAGAGGTGELTDEIAVLLTPKSEELKKHVASVRVLIDERVPCAKQVVIVDPDGDETELTFSAVKINTGMKEEALELKLPEGTKISAPVEAGAGK